MTTVEPEIIDDLDALTDDELRAIAAKSTEILDTRDRQRKNDARERARAILAEAGLKLPEERGKPGRRAAS